MTIGTAVVTGAESGAGAAIGAELADRATVLVLGVKEQDLPERLDGALSAGSAEAVTVRTDVRDEYDLERLMETATRHGSGGIDLLVPAGRVMHIDPATAPLDGAYAAIDDEWRTNVRGVFAAIKEARPHLAEAARIAVPKAPQDETTTMTNVYAAAIEALTTTIAASDSWAIDAIEMPDTTDPASGDATAFVEAALSLDTQ